MVNYQNGKVYAIYNKITGKLVYIGSTCQKLCRRFGGHCYKSTIQNSNFYQEMKEFGVENFYIELIENFPCNSKEELLAREGHYFRLNKDILLNEKTPDYSNREEIRETEEFKEKRKEEYINRNKDKINCECGSEVIKDKLEIHYLSNKHKEYLKEIGKENEIIEKIKDRSKERIKYECECGSKIQKCEKARHKKSKKHLDFLKLKIET
jgi:hypothetical protein